MRKIILALLILPLSPAFAQDTPAVPKADTEEGFSLMEEGAKLFMRGLMSEMEPALNEMGEAVALMEPALRDMLALIDDIRNYESPKMLENGDIIIRRKPTALPPVKPGAEIEL